MTLIRDLDSFLFDVPIVSSTAACAWADLWLPFTGISKMDFNLLLENIVQGTGGAGVELLPSWQLAEYRTDWPTSNNPVTGSSPVTTAKAFTHFQQSLTPSAHYFIRPGIQYKLSSGTSARAQGRLHTAFTSGAQRSSSNPPPARGRVARSAGRGFLDGAGPPASQRVPMWAGPRCCCPRGASAPPWLRLPQPPPHAAPRRGVKLRRLSRTAHLVRRRSTPRFPRPARLPATYRNSCPRRRILRQTRPTPQPGPSRRTAEMGQVPVVGLARIRVLLRALTTLKYSV